MKGILSLVAALISCTAATPVQPLKIISSRQLEACPANGNLPPNYLAPTMMVPSAPSFQTSPLAQLKHLSSHRTTSAPSSTSLFRLQQPGIPVPSSSYSLITCRHSARTCIAEVDTLHSRVMHLALVQRSRRRITTSRLLDRVLPNHRRSLAQGTRTRSMWDRVGWSLRTVWKSAGCCVVMIQRIRICRLRGMNLGARLGSLLLSVRRICWGKLVLACETLMCCSLLSFEGALQAKVIYNEKFHAMYVPLIYLSRTSSLGR
jgi:hypothetical protein